MALARTGRRRMRVYAGEVGWSVRSPAALRASAR